jgi:predicted ester cyclase
VEKARQAWNDGDLNGYLSLYDDGVRLHGYAATPMDKPSVGDFYRMIWGALTEVGRSSPPLEFHEILVDGDLYCCRFTMAGVHNGEFMGFPASGRPFSLPGITIMRFNADRVIERWSTADFLSMLTQIGALPASV